MILVLDVGNTNITFGAYEEEKLVTTFTSCLAQRGFIWQVVWFLESRMENSLLWHITERYMRMPVLMPLSKI